ncbi:Forkhead transcription factor [Lecanora helva]
MAFTRRLEIFQDPDPVPDPQQLSPETPYPLTAGAFNDENSQSGYFSRGDIILDPPAYGPNGRSPLKPIRQTSSSPPKVSFDEKTVIPLPPPQPSTFTTDSPVKQPCIVAYDPIASQHTAAKPFFTTFSSIPPTADENFRPIYYNDNIAPFPEPSCGPRKPLKRSLSNANAQQDRPLKKGRGEESMGPDDLEFMPLAPDDGRKPPYSYAALIGMSILRAPGRRLTLAQIYKWISDQFSHYRIQDTGWQNSIRHNLSLNKAFVKQERPKDDPGKGNYWVIEPGMESQFYKDKPIRRPTSSSGPSTKSITFVSSEANNRSSQPPPNPPVEIAPKASKRVHEIVDLSSDATIPASDEPSQDDEVREVASMPPPASRLPLSSPLQNVHSSPPVSHSTSFRDDTPSPEGNYALPSNGSRSRKRKLAAMEDSGYFSSLDSSASRSFANPKLPNPNSVKPRLKRGRAEEEIARIRSSSHEASPSKGRSVSKQTNPSLVSSSPLRHFDSGLMLPPLTPALKFKLPPKPPASISPNTNLRNHRNKIRELVGSPNKDTSLFSDDVAFSPAFHIAQDENNFFENDYPAFNIFTDNNDESLPRPASSSPIKRSAKRLRTDRASKTSNILADVTGTSLNRRASPSSSKIINLESPLQRKTHHKSPLAFSTTLEDVAGEDLFGLDFLEEEEPDDFGGLDILQGFQKIGGHQVTPLAKKASRPGLGSRTNTSRF